MDRIYLDNAATTAVSQPVMEAMLPYYMQVYGNPSSIHSTGRDAKKAVERARRQVAAALGCSAQEIYFTAGGSESDNWALKGAAFAHQPNSLPDRIWRRIVSRVSRGARAIGSRLVATRTCAAARSGRSGRPARRGTRRHCAGASAGAGRRSGHQMADLGRNALSRPGRQHRDRFWRCRCAKSFA